MLHWQYLVDLSIIYKQKGIYRYRVYTMGKNECKKEKIFWIALHVHISIDCYCIILLDWNAKGAAIISC